MTLEMAATEGFPSKHAIDHARKHANAHGWCVRLAWIATDQVDGSPDASQRRNLTSRPQSSAHIPQ
jgi:hypothetical protein